MAGVVLTAEDRAYVLAALRRQGNSAVHWRMNALLLDDGWASERVAEALFIGPRRCGRIGGSTGVSGRAGVERLAYAGHAPVLGEA